MILKKNWNISNRLLKFERMQRCKLGDCRAACCLYGVWLDQLEAADILQHADLIRPHLDPAYANPDTWIEDQIESDPHSLSGQVVHSRVVEDKNHYGETACVFLRKDHKCSLQVTAEMNGFHPWRFKPFYCILHPLDIDDDGRITLDETEAMLAEPGSCLRPAGKPIALVETFAPELKYLLGERGYAEIKWRLVQSGDPNEQP